MQTQTSSLVPTLMTLDFEGDAVRIDPRDGEPWFVAKDICRCLEIDNPSDALKRLDEDEVTLGSIEGNHRQINLINEPGMYSLILGSRKKSAKKFKRWVTHEVLPTIRRTGSYGVAGFDMEQEADDTRLYLNLVNECRRTFGRAASQRMWRLLPLPQVDDGPRQIAVGDHAIDRFMDERTETGENFKSRASDLYAAYADWCAKNGTASASLTAFGRALGERYVKNKGNGGFIWYEGVTLT